MPRRYRLRPCARNDRWRSASTPSPSSGRRIGRGAAGPRLRELIEEIVLADQVGLDVFGVASTTGPTSSSRRRPSSWPPRPRGRSGIRLTSAVTVLSSDDPVRVFQEFATLDLISGGRAEIMAGRGSFIESFPLFGYDLGDYDALFAEKLELLLELRESERVTWPGATARRSTTRRLSAPGPGSAAGLDRRRRHARIGGAGRRLGLPMAFAIIGGDARAIRAFRRALPRVAPRRATDACS